MLHHLIAFSVLQELDLGHNAIGDAGMEQLRAALKKQNKLEILNLEDNKITGEGF